MINALKNIVIVSEDYIIRNTWFIWGKCVRELWGNGIWTGVSRDYRENILWRQNSIYRGPVLGVNVAHSNNWEVTDEARA